MKQKLFGALALSVALAACTNEEELVISTNGGNAQLAGRPVVGQVDLTTTPATRAAVVDGTWGALTYQTGDAIGAALVDEPVLTAKTGYIKKDGIGYFNTWSYAEYVKGKTKKLYTDFSDPDNPTGKKDDTEYVVTNTKKSAADDAANWKSEDYYALCGNGSVDNIIHTNYGYTNNNGSWTTEANLVEGHYMFYFPFNANNSARLPINVEIPATQDCSDGNSAIDKFYAESTSPIAVDVKFLKKPAAGQKVAVNATPNHLFAFPQFKIVNNFNGYKYNVKYTGVSGTSVDPKRSGVAESVNAATTTMTIDKVEIFYTGTDNKLWANATLNASKLNNRVGSNWEANKFTSASYTSHVTEEPAVRTNFVPALYPYLNDAYNNAKYNIDQVITCNINKELTYGQSYTFNAIMPAEDYGQGKLSARVYVTIGNQKYVMLTSTNDAGGYDESGNETSGKDGNGNIISRKATNIGVFTFAKPVELVRGERYTIIEYKTNSDGETDVKGTAGSILTINLNGLHAFEVGDDAPEAIERGFADEDAFKAYLSDVVRGETLIEDNKEGDATLAEYHIAFKNNITLNAGLVEDIYNNVNYGTMDAHLELNYTNLAISNDVTVTKTTGSKVGYQYYCLTGNNKTIKIRYKEDIIQKSPGSLKSGINNITSNGTLSKYQYESTGLGVVFVDNKNVTIAGSANTFRFIINAGTLNVNGTCDAKIETSNTAITIDPTSNSSKLTNGNNKYTNGTIQNNKLRTVAGNNVGARVSAELSAWPSSVPSDCMVKYITINGTSTITVEQAGFNIFLPDTEITLGNTVKEIRSNADVNLTTTNIKKLTGTATKTVKVKDEDGTEKDEVVVDCHWIGGSNGNIVVTGSNNHQIIGIVKGNACSIITIAQ